MDCTSFPALFRRRAVVFTDTADFTVRTLRDGILHFLMVFERVARRGGRGRAARPAGELVKVEADSLLLRFPDVTARLPRRGRAGGAAAAAATAACPENERLRFSYGIGYGDVLDLDDDIFGLEVNLASKLGEDLAEPGEALLTPAAAEALRRTALERGLAITPPWTSATRAGVRRLGFEARPPALPPRR